MSSRNMIYLAVLLELLIAGYSIVADGWTLEALHTTTRLSGRLSLALFSVIFLGLNNPRKLVVWLSPYFFLVFALAHGIHLAELLAYVGSAGIKLIPIRVLGGFLAYMFVFAMPVIHHHFLKGKLSPKQFSMITNIYQYYLWLIFFMTYLPRVLGKLPNVGGHHWEFVVAFVCLIVMMLLKISMVLRLTPARNP